MSGGHGIRNAALALAVLSLIWGYNFVVMKTVMPYVDPFQFSAMRTVLGAATLFLVLAWLRKPLRPVAPVPTLVLGILQTAVFTALLQWALVSGAAGKTAVLIYSMPFWLLPLAWVALGERIQGLQWARGRGCCGRARLHPRTVAGARQPDEQCARARGRLCLGSERCPRETAARACRTRSALPDRVADALRIAVAGRGRPCGSRRAPSEVSTYFVGALAFNALLGTGLAWVLWLYVLDTLPAGVAGLSSLAVPAVGVLAAWLELGERPSSSETVGMILIAASLGLLCAIAIARHRARRSGRAGVRGNGQLESFVPPPHRIRKRDLWVSPERATLIPSRRIGSRGSSGRPLRQWAWTCEATCLGEIIDGRD